MGLTASYKEVINFGVRYQFEATQALKGMRDVEKASKSLSAQMGGLGKAISKTALPLAIAGASLSSVTMGLRKATRGAFDFEHAMSGVAAVAQPTTRELSRLRKQAVSLSLEPLGYSAREAAGAMEELARVGFTTNEVLAATPGVMAAAAAEGMTMAKAAEIVGITIRGMRLEARQAGHVADVLALAAARTNESIVGFGEAMTYGASQAAQMGLSLEETVAAFGTMANFGRRASLAGTSFRQMLVRIANPTNDAIKMFIRMGLSQKDVSVRTHGLIGLIDNLRKGMARLSVADRERATSVLFGIRGMDAANALLATSTTRLVELTEALKKADGQAELMARTRLDNVAGAMKMLSGAVGSFFIEGMKGFQKPLQKKILQVRDALASVVIAMSALNNMDPNASPLEQWTQASQEVGRRIGDLRATAKRHGAMAFFLDPDKSLKAAKGIMDAIHGIANGFRQIENFGRRVFEFFGGKNLNVEQFARMATIFTAVAAALGPVLVALAGMNFILGNSLEMIGGLAGGAGRLATSAHLPGMAAGGLGLAGRAGRGIGGAAAAGAGGWGGLRTSLAGSKIAWKGKMARDAIFGHTYGAYHKKSVVAGAARSMGGFIRNAPGRFDNALVSASGLAEFMPGAYGNTPWGHRGARGRFTRPISRGGARLRGASALAGRGMRGGLRGIGAGARAGIGGIGAGARALPGLAGRGARAGGRGLLKGLGGAAGLLIGAPLSGLGAIGGALMSALAPALPIVAALAGLFLLLRKDGESVGTTLARIGGVLAGGFKKAVEGTVKGFKTFWTWLQPLLVAIGHFTAPIAALFQTLAGPIVKMAWTYLKLVFTVISAIVKGVLKLATVIVEKLTPYMHKLGDVLQPIFKKIGQVFEWVSGLMEKIIGFINKLSGEEKKDKTGATNAAMAAAEQAGVQANKAYSKEDVLAEIAAAEEASKNKNLQSDYAKKYGPIWTKYGMPVPKIPLPNDKGELNKTEQDAYKDKWDELQRRMGQATQKLDPFQQSEINRKTAYWQGQLDIANKQGLGPQDPRRLLATQNLDAIRGATLDILATKVGKDMMPPPEYTVMIENHTNVESDTPEQAGTKVEKRRLDISRRSGGKTSPFQRSFVWDHGGSTAVTILEGSH